MRIVSRFRCFASYCADSLVPRDSFPSTVRAAPDQVASVEELKSEAFKAIRGGHFDRSNELLAAGRRHFA